MRRALLYLGRGLLALAVGAAIATVSVVAISQTQAAREFIRRQTLGYLNRTYKGSFDIAKIDGSVLFGITLHGVAVSYRNTETLRVTAISARYSIVHILLGRIDLPSIEMDSAIGNLVQESDGAWNLIEALSARKPGRGSKKRLHLTIGHFALRDSTFLVSRGGKRYQIDPALVDARLQIDGRVIQARVRRVAVSLATPGIPIVAAAGSMAYKTDGLRASIEIPQVALSAGQSHATVSGAITNLAYPEVDASIDIDRLAGADIERFIPRWSPQQSIVGRMRLRGPKDALEMSARLSVADGKIDARGVADLAGASPRFRARIEAAGINAGATIQRAGMGGMVDVTLDAQGTGIALDRIDADATVAVRDPQIGPIRSKLITMRGSLRESVAAVSGRLTGGAGEANWQGKIDLRPAHNYSMTVALNRLNLRKAAAGKRPVDSNLNVRAQIEGEGFAPAKMRTRAQIAILPSMMGRVQITSGRVDARVAGQALRTKVTIAGPAATFRAESSVALTGNHRLRLGYELESTDLAPWLGLVGANGGGALTLSGRAYGVPDALRTEDRLSFTSLSYGNNYAGCGTASIEMADAGRPRMRGSVSISVHEIRGAISLKTLVVEASMAQLRPTTVVSISAQAEDERSMRHRLDGEFRRAGSRNEIALSRVSIETPQGTWTSVSPAQIATDANGVTIHRLEVASGEKRILVDGRAGTSGAQNLMLEVDSFPLSAFGSVVPGLTGLSGNLSVHARAEGTAESPLIRGTLDIKALHVAVERYQGLSASFGYGRDLATVDLVLDQDSAHRLNARATLPAVLSWAPTLEAKATGELDSSAASAGLSLAFVNALTTGTVRNVKGVLLLNMKAKGPVRNPAISGFAAIAGGSASVVPTGVKIDDIELSAQFTPELVDIGKIRMASRSGTIDGRGRIVVHRYTPGNIEATIHISGWPAIWNRQYRALVNGQIAVSGAPSDLRVDGNIAVVNALLRPDIGFLANKPPPPDPTIHIVPAKPPPLPKANPEKRLCPTPAKLPNGRPNAKPAERVSEQKRLSLDIEADLGRDIWIRDENGSAQLSGHFRAVKTSAGPMRLTGRVDAIRGWLTIMGKLFTVTHARIEFTGAVPIDPGLDITADYRSSQYVVHVTIGGTANEPTLYFRSEPDLDQADILSVLLFGKPAGQLSGGQRADLNSQATQLAAGYAASEVGRQVSEALGLEEMGIEIRQTSSGFGVGSAVGENTYATIWHDYRQAGGQRVDLQHFLTPHWEIDTDTTSRGDRGADLIWSTNY